MTLDCQSDESPILLTNPPSCALYIRVSSGTGEKLAGAHASVGEKAESYAADGYGRIFAQIPLLNAVAAARIGISDSGYGSETIELACKPGGIGMEREVRLKRGK